MSISASYLRIYFFTWKENVRNFDFVRSISVSTKLQHYSCIQLSFLEDDENDENLGDEC